MINLFKSFFNWFINLFPSKQFKSPEITLYNINLSNKVIKDITPTKKALNKPIYRDRTKWTKEYDKKPEVIERKKAYYQANKKKFNENKRLKRQLDKQNKKNKDPKYQKGIKDKQLN